MALSKSDLESPGAEPDGPPPGTGRARARRLPVAGVRRRALGAWGWFALGVVCLLAIIAGFSGNAYWLNVFTLALLFGGLASAWNVIGGFGGQFSLGHAVFFGAGAYVVALFSTKLGWSVWTALVPGVALAVALALLLALPIFRFRGPFFAIGTLAISVVAEAVVNYLSFTGGARGVSLPYDAGFVDQADYGYLMVGYAAFSGAVALFVARRRLGFYLFAVREDEDAAQAVGVNPFRVKTAGLVISAALTGLGGGLYTVFIQLVTPDSVFSIQDIAVEFPLLALIGGVGTVAGPFVGALIIIPGDNYLQGSLGPSAHVIVLGALLVLAALFFKRGVVGTIAAVAGAAWRRWKRPPAQVPSSAEAAR